MSEMSGSYNAVTWLLDRNVEQGRAEKLAFTDTVSELTYGALQQQTCRVANLLRRLGFRREERAGESPAFATAATHADEPAFWLYSSGSTGMPKGVRHLHSSLAATAETYAKQVLGIREDDVGLSAAKLFFAYGLGNALTFPMSVGASTLLNSCRPPPVGLSQLMSNYHPPIFCA